MNETVKTVLYATSLGVAGSLVAKKTGLDTTVGMALGSAIGTLLATPIKSNTVSGLKFRKH